MKTKIRKSLNLILGALLGVLGFGCSSMPVEYGTPHANFTAQGKVVNEANEPLENIQIIVKRGWKGDTNNISWEDWHDILYTNTEGEYYMYHPDVFPLTYNRVITNDTTGVYASDSLDVNTRYSKGDGHWNYGESILTVDFVLKEKHNN